MKYIPFPATTHSFMNDITTNLTVRLLLRLFVQFWRFSTIYEYKWGTMELLNHSLADWWGISNIWPHTVAAHDRRNATKPACWVRTRDESYVAMINLDEDARESETHMWIRPMFVIAVLIDHIVFYQKPDPFYPQTQIKSNQITETSPLSTEK